MSHNIVSVNNKFGILFIHISMIVISSEKMDLVKQYKCLEHLILKMQSVCVALSLGQSCIKNESTFVIYF